MFKIPSKLNYYNEYSFIINYFNKNIYSIIIYILLNENVVSIRLRRMGDINNALLDIIKLNISSYF